jgi:hypothetical protein
MSWPVAVAVGALVLAGPVLSYAGYRAGGALVRQAREVRADG